jgi:CYTH domain-containing protein
MSIESQPKYERERRFLVADPSIVQGWESVLITQAYVFARDGYAVRIRRIQKEVRDGALIELDATVAVKGPRIGDEREEYETKVDNRLSAEIIARSSNVIRKRRYQVIDGPAWDIDEFLDDNAGLMIAELEGSDVRSAVMPVWASKEITYDARYNNDELALHPFSKWQKDGGVHDDVWDV